jgi:hypothetical protein
MLTLTLNNDVELPALSFGVFQTDCENVDVFDFELTSEDLGAIDALDTEQRGGPEPSAITLEVFGREIPEA